MAGEGAMSDFSCSKFEIQVKYNTGWETVSRPDPFYVCIEWHGWRERYKTIQLRLLQDGKEIR